MKIKEGFIKKKLGTGYVVVAVGQASKEFNGMIRLNGTGSFLWESIQNGADTKEKLVRVMTDSFEGLDAETAGKDLDEFLETIDFALDK